MTDSEVTTHHGEKTTAINQFYDDLREVWQPNYIYSSKQRQAAESDSDSDCDKLPVYPTDYIVVGPIRGDLQRVTVNMLLEKYGPSSGGHNHQISIDAVLVTIGNIRQSCEV